MIQFLTTAQLGNTYVDVYTDHELNGGNLAYCPEDPKKEKPRLTIGTDYGPHGWPRCLSVLMHEAWEYILIQLNVRFARDGDFANNSADYFFFMDHQIFAEACARVAYFMRDVVPLLATVYNNKLDKETRSTAAKEYYNPYV